MAVKNTNSCLQLFKENIISLVACPYTNGKIYAQNCYSFWGTSSDSLPGLWIPLGGSAPDPLTDLFRICLHSFQYLCIRS